MPVAVERFVNAIDLLANTNSFIFAVCTSGSGAPTV